MNQMPWRDAPILITGANFGSGSSREQAVWALLGQGIRCVVAESFGEIFYGNCFRNGVLPIVLSLATIAALAAAAQSGQPFIIDLETQTIRVGDAPPLAFEIAAQHRLALLNGWDETDMILNARSDAIAAFEDRHRRIQPWLFETEEPS
jgi:3-isopropylmalate/(R)-2-methylmalate dehydratase small subunit